MTIRILQAMVAAWLLVSWGAQASDNPMTTSESYGLASCGAHCARADDPMVWPALQWRGTLFGCARDYDRRYDNRFHWRFHRHFHRRFEGHAAHLWAARLPGFFAIDIPREAAEILARDVFIRTPRKREPQIWIDGVKTRWADTSVGAATRSRTRCGGPGMLVLIWTGTRAETVCPALGSWRGRIITPSVEPPPSADQG